MTAGVLLYGGPASGKDTVTRHMCERDPRIRLFPILKAGPGKTDGYRMTTAEAIDARTDLLWRVERYDAVYAASRADLAEAIGSGIRPIVHVGSPDRLDAILTAGLGDWLTVELWCPLDVATDRLRRRNPHDVQQRLAVWHQTPRLNLQLRIDTSSTSPAEAARSITARLIASDAPPT